jgi:hypothetical protein
VSDKKEVVALSPGQRVKQISTNKTGVVVKSEGEQTFVEFDGIGQFRIMSHDLKAYEKTEHELVAAYRAAVERKKAAAAETKAAASAFGQAEEELLKFLIDNTKQQTERFADVGYVEIVGNEVRARINEEDVELAFEEIRAMGRADLIKASIHPATLSTFVRECLDDPKKSPLPAHVKYFLQPKLSLKKA